MRISPALPAGEGFERMPGKGSSVRIQLRDQPGTVDLRERYSHAARGRQRLWLALFGGGLVEENQHDGGVRGEVCYARPNHRGRLGELLPSHRRREDLLTELVVIGQKVACEP